MRLLFCCEFYYPSVGGVQEVMRQIAERMVQRGHDVTVATTRLADRNFTEHNGVKIAEFGVTGNLVRGIEGEIERYRQFAMSFECDAILIKAAQQWTFDALWPVLDKINRRKVFIPCGFSGLYEPTYKEYFVELPDILRKFDHLIFYAERYRDIDFAREHNIQHFSVLANGASEIEFNVPQDSTFREKLGIPENSFVLLTVGSITGVKGHREIAEAFARMDTRGRHVTLILNGNLPPKPHVKLGAASSKESMHALPEEGQFKKTCAFIASRIQRVSGLAYRSIGVLRREGLDGIKQRITALLPSIIQSILFKKTARPLEYWIDFANQQGSNKLVLTTDFGRQDLVQAYIAADLFVFASNIEYSPLVLFEATAAGTPFLSVPVGNAEEIARWTEGGIICPAPKDERGYTRVKPSELAKAIRRTMNDEQKLLSLGKKGRENWARKYTWAAIAERYEHILQGVKQDITEKA